MGHRHKGTQEHRKARAKERKEGKKATKECNERTQRKNATAEGDERVMVIAKENGWLKQRLNGKLSL